MKAKKIKSVLSSSLLRKTLFVLLILTIGVSGGYFYARRQSPASQTPVSPENKYITFLNEVYETIEKNYWNKVPQEKLADLFLKGSEKLIGQPQTLKSPDKKNLMKLLESLLDQIDDEGKKKEFSARLADIVLANLEPFGRSRLYTKKEEKQLSQAVKNITNTDYYQVLDVEKNAPKEKIEKSYQEKKKVLEKKAQTSEKAKKELEKLEKAYQTLGDSQARKLYDTAGVEPTLSYELISPQVLYLHFTKISPTSLQDLQRTTEKFKGRKGLNSLIVDLRDNVGGSIDTLPYLLGPFIGNNQYAYQFLHQGEVVDFKTRIGWMPSLIQYKKVVVLINENTQSSAEVMAATLKKYNVGVLVGTTTKGWGTVERVFPLQLDPSEKYSIFLVHSLTLREDGKPIQGNGVTPTISIKDANWEEQLREYFDNGELIKAVRTVVDKG
jgi:hypothetical protein